MEEKTTVQCWEDLANAVVMQAIADYAWAVRRLKKRPDLKAVETERRSLERFFGSRWFHTLSGLDKETLKIMIRKEIVSHDSRCVFVPAQDIGSPD